MRVDVMGLTFILAASMGSVTRCLCLAAAVWLGTAPVGAASASSRGTTTIYLLRHAEKAKGQGKNPNLAPAGHRRAKALAKMLGNTRLRAIYATTFKRTQQTVAPLAKKRRMKTKVVSARRTKSLMREILKKHRGGAVVVAAHSTTLPSMLKALGVKERVRIAERDFGDLYAVVVRGKRVRMKALRYGD